MGRLRLGLFASHNGSTVQAILDACREGRLDAEPSVVICNNRNAHVLVRAESAGVPWRHLSSRTHPDPEALDFAILDTLQAHHVDLLVLAGYMRKLGPRTVERYPNRILNIHPALLPKFGGQGMYGRYVFEAVLAAGEKETGATIHLVDEEYDHGHVLAQRTLPVLESDTVESLMARSQPVEHALYVDTLQDIATGRIRLPGFRE